MRVLCTGGAGYVGSACLRWLLAHGHDAIAFDNLSEGNLAAVPEGRLIIGDIEDYESLLDAMKTHQVDAVMHFAAAASVPDSIVDPEFYYRSNVIGTKNVLDAMRAAGVQRILLSSTAATYAFNNQMPLQEDSLLQPVVPYGTTKLTAEQMIKEYAKAYGIGYTILRYFNASGADIDGQYGEDRNKESHLIPLILYAAQGKTEKINIYGGDWNTPDGTCIRDFVHTADLGQAHLLAVEAIVPGEGEVYNLGSGKGATVMEVLKNCEKIVGSPIPHSIEERRPGDPGILIASSDKIKQKLGWEPQYSGIETIVKSAWKWHSSHPEGYKSKEKAYIPNKK